jgi:uncharacterized damage-inducible protein DinB
MKSLLEETIEAWEDTRQGVIAEVENVPTKDFGFRPNAEMRTVAELVVHIMEVGLMMTGELSRPDGSFRRKPYPKLIDEYASGIQGLSKKRELIAALNRTFRDGAKAFRDAGEIHMLQTITRFDGNQGTRMAWFNHGIAHEMYHRGQLALYQRQMGLTPALTKLIRGE